MAHSLWWPDTVDRDKPPPIVICLDGAPFPGSTPDTALVVEDEDSVTGFRSGLSQPVVPHKRSKPDLTYYAHHSVQTYISQARTSGKCSCTSPSNLSCCPCLFDNVFLFEQPIGQMWDHLSCKDRSSLLREGIWHNTVRRKSYIKRLWIVPHPRDQTIVTYAISGEIPHYQCNISDCMSILHDNKTRNCLPSPQDGPIRCLIVPTLNQTIPWSKLTCLLEKFGSNGDLRGQHSYLDLGCMETFSSRMLYTPKHP